MAICFVDDDLNLVDAVLEDDDRVNANVTSGCPLSQAILATQTPETVFNEGLDEVNVIETMLNPMCWKI
ncbi:MAG: hypothetical protein M1830_001847, partial [Pleopsidium flavum]